MSVVPKTTSPMTKAVRTLEGVLVLAFNIGMVVVPIVSNALSATQAVKYAAIVNIALVVCRTGLKAVAAMSTTTGLTPAQIGSASLAPDVGTLAAEVVKQLAPVLSGQKVDPSAIIADIQADLPAAEQIKTDAFGVPTPSDPTLPTTVA